MNNLVKKILQILGLDVRLTKNVRRSAIISWEQKQDAMWQPFLAHLDIRTVIDVGANEGQFATLIHRQCPAASIVSVEPLENCHAELSAALSKIPGSRIIKSAAGDVPGKVIMNESDFSPCSSILPGSEFLVEVSNAAASTSPVEISVVRLDDELCVDDLEDDVLVKLDVQGYEVQAIQGAEKLFKKAKIVVCEVCFFRKLYDGQPLFGEIFSELSSRGFTYMGNVEQSARKIDGRVVEADAIFERLS